MRKIVASHLPSIVALNAPDGGDHMAVDTVAPLRRPQRLIVLAHHRLAVSHALLVHQEGEIVPDRRLEFRLDLGKTENSVVRLLKIERSMGEIRADARGGDARPEVVDASSETLCRCRGRR